MALVCTFFCTAAVWTLPKDAGGRNELVLGGTVHTLAPVIVVRRGERFDLRSPDYTPIFLAAPVAAAISASSQTSQSTHTRATASAPNRL